MLNAAKVIETEQKHFSCLIKRNRYSRAVVKYGRVLGVKEFTLSWRHYLSNWLSNGKLHRYQQQFQSAQTQLEEKEKEIGDLEQKLQSTLKELQQTQAQLQICQGSQSELRKKNAQHRQDRSTLENCQKQLQQTKEELKRSQALLSQIKAKNHQNTDWLDKIAEEVKIAKVERLSYADPEDLWGFFISIPKAAIKITGGSLIVTGWVLGKKSPATTVRIVCQDRVLQSTPVDRPRPSLSQKYPGIPQINTCGFETSVAVVGIPKGTEYIIEAILEGDRVIPLSIIRFAN